MRVVQGTVNLPMSSLSLFNLGALVVSLAALAGWINHRWLRLPHSIGLVLIALAVSFAALLIDAAIPSLGLERTVRDTLIRIDFYDRLERLLRRHRWKRLPGQTQREFSQQVAHWIDTQLNRPTVKNLPGKITEAYYQLRFGGRDLTLAERDSIDQALTQLEQALAQPAKH